MTIKIKVYETNELSAFGKAYHDFVKRCWTDQKPNYSEKTINFLLDCAHIANGTSVKGLPQQGFKLTKAGNVDIIGDCLHLCYNEVNGKKAVDIWLNPHTQKAIVDLDGFNPEDPYSSTRKEFSVYNYTADDFCEFIESLPNYKGESYIGSTRTREAKELPAGAVYIKDLPDGKSFTLKPYDDEPPESAIWSYSGFWAEDNSYWAYRWSNVNNEREFKPNTIVYPL